MDQDMHDADSPFLALLPESLLKTSAYEPDRPRLMPNRVFDHATDAIAASHSSVTVDLRNLRDLFFSFHPVASSEVRREAGDVDFTIRKIEANTPRIHDFLDRMITTMSLAQDEDGVVRLQPRYPIRSAPDAACQWNRYLATRPQIVLLVLFNAGVYRHTALFSRYLTFLRTNGKTWGILKTAFPFLERAVAQLVAYIVHSRVT
jgi:hypothetical protein